MNPLRTPRLVTRPRTSATWTDVKFPWQIYAGAGLYLAFVGAIAYVAIHFLSRYW